MLVLAALSLSAPALRADGGTYGSYSPYSIYGIGDMAQPGTAYNRSMGGVGIASRNIRFINILNPAAVTARDTLSFMVDFSLYGDNKLFSQKGASDVMFSANNTFNINDCVISFPIWKSSAMMVGINPYSSTGYGYVQYGNNPSITGHTGNITYSNTGQGSIYQMFAAAGVTFFKKLSLGAEFIYYFGNIEKKFTQSFDDDSFVGSKRSNSVIARASTAKFGIQYDQPIGKKDVLCLGATYTLGTRLGGYMQSLVGNDTTTVEMGNLHGADRIMMASEIGVGVSYRHADKLSMEIDYTRSDWSGTNIGRTSTVSGFNPVASQAFRAGMEIVPNRSDIRYYFKRVAYRAGAYYKNEYYQFNGHNINSMGITLGATLPVFRWYNGLTLGIDFGQRGSMADAMIRERYINFSIGASLHDIWFRKVQYD